MKAKSNSLKLNKKKNLPLTGHEKKLIIIFNILLFLITLNYGMLRVMKDTKMLDKANSDFTSFVKLWFIIPFMVFFKFIYDTLARYVGRNNMFYWLVGIFTTFFITYYFFLQNFEGTPPGAKDKNTPYIDILRYIWPIVAFYVMAETWGTYMLSVSFWSLANRVMSNQQAKRFYTTLSIGAAIATFLAGVASYFIKNGDFLIWVILGCNVFLVGSYYYLMRDMKENAALYPQLALKKRKSKLGFFASIKALVTSEDAAYLGLILILVLGYGMGINFFETVYKQRAKATGIAKGDKGYVGEILSMQLMAIGVISLLLVFGAHYIKKQGWRFTASVVPVVLGVGTLIFFGVCYWFGTDIDIATSHALVLLGMGVVAIVKASKYVFFDTTKEQTYKVSSEETQNTGKSAVDGVGSRFSKAISSGTVGIIMTVFGGNDILPHTNLVGFLLLLVLAVWLIAVGALSKRYGKRLDDYEAKKAKEKAQKKMAIQPVEPPKVQA